MGYPDFQRLSTRTAALLTDVTWSPGNETASPIVDVSAFANVTVIASIAGAAPASCAIQWLSTAGASPAKIAQYFAVHPSITNDLVLRVPILMPYAQLFANTTKGATSGTLDLLADNGPAGPRTVPQSTAHGFNTVTQPANSSQVVFPPDYYSGPATVAFYASAVGVAYGLASYDPALNVENLMTLENGANFWTTVAVNLPPSAWYVLYNNTSAAAELMGFQITT